MAVRRHQSWALFSWCLWIRIPCVLLLLSYSFLFVLLIFHSKGHPKALLWCCCKVICTLLHQRGRHDRAKEYSSKIANHWDWVDVLGISIFTSDTARLCVAPLCFSFQSANMISQLHLLNASQEQNIHITFTMCLYLSLAWLQIRIIQMHYSICVDQIVDVFFSWLQPAQRQKCGWILGFQSDVLELIILARSLMVLVCLCFQGRWTKEWTVMEFHEHLIQAFSSGL